MGYSSMVEHLPNMCEALGPIPSNEIKQKNRGSVQSLILLAVYVEPMRISVWAQEIRLNSKTLSRLQTESCPGLCRQDIQEQVNKREVGD